MAAPMDDKIIYGADYLNPELLTKETLISILNEKRMCPVDMEAMDKHKLVDFFYNYLIPLPQRLDCKSRRWQRLYDKFSKKDSHKRTLESNESETNGNRKKTKISKSDSKERSDVMKETTKRNEKPTCSLNCKVRKLNLNESNQSKTDKTTEMKQKHQRITWP